VLLASVLLPSDIISDSTEIAAPGDVTVVRVETEAVRPVPSTPALRAPGRRYFALRPGGRYGRSDRRPAVPAEPREPAHSSLRAAIPAPGRSDRTVPKPLPKPSVQRAETVGVSARAGSGWPITMCTTEFGGAGCLACAAAKIVYS
jgi:hypothetical protein